MHVICFIMSTAVDNYSKRILQLLDHIILYVMVVTSIYLQRAQYTVKYMLSYLFSFALSSLELSSRSLTSHREVVKSPPPFDQNIDINCSASIKCHNPLKMCG